MDSLDKLLRNVQKKFGEGSLVMPKEGYSNMIERIPVSSPKIGDVFGGGGIPRGRIIELFGPESSGKTSLASYLAGQVQRHYFEDKKRKGLVAFIDAEHAFDPEYAETLGFDSRKALFSQPNSGEQALDITLELVESGEVDFIIVDSVAALTPRSELEGEMGDMQMGAQARLLGKGVRKITAALDQSKCSLLFINQLRSNIGGYGNPEVTPGGKALKFFSSIRIEIRKIEFMNEKNEIIGLRSRIKGVKNKTAPPMKKHEIEMFFGRGFDVDLEWVDFAILHGVVKQAGAWFNILNNEEKLQGKHRVIEYLKNNPEEYNEVIEKTKKIMYHSIKNEQVADEKESEELEELEEVKD